MKSTIAMSSFTDEKRKREDRDALVSVLKRVLSYRAVSGSFNQVRRRRPSKPMPAMAIRAIEVGSGTTFKSPLKKNAPTL
jgi:hypothetical protein